MTKKINKKEIWSFLSFFSFIALCVSLFFLEKERLLERTEELKKEISIGKEQVLLLKMLLFAFEKAPQEEYEASEENQSQEQEKQQIQESNYNDSSWKDISSTSFFVDNVWDSEK